MCGSGGATRAQASHGGSKALHGAAEPSRNPREQPGPERSPHPAEGARPRSASGNRCIVTAEPRHRTHRHLPPYLALGNPHGLRCGSSSLLIAPCQCPSSPSITRCTADAYGEMAATAAGRGRGYNGHATPPQRGHTHVQRDHAPSIKPRPQPTTVQKHTPHPPKPRPFPGRPCPFTLGHAHRGDFRRPVRAPLSAHARGKGDFFLYFGFSHSSGPAPPSALPCPLCEKTAEPVADALPR